VGRSVRPLQTGTRGRREGKVVKIPVIVSDRFVLFIFRFCQAFACNFIGIVRADDLYTPPSLSRFDRRRVTRQTKPED